MTAAQLRLVAALQSRDREVRDHEAAHQAAGGNLVGGASYSYQQGPDGRSYAVGGEVSVDASPVQGDPRATIAKMQRVRAAALAPAQPSGQDLAVAAAAAQLEASAEQELTQEQAKSSTAPGSTSQGGSGATSSAVGGSTLLGATSARRDAISAYARSAASGAVLASSIDFSA